MDTDNEAILEAHRKLIAMTFEPISLGKRRRRGETDASFIRRKRLYENWYRSMVVGMLVRPVNINESHALAIRVAGVLNLKLNQDDSAIESPYPRWHMGFPATRNYFINNVKARKIGARNDFDQINLFCETHKLTWNNTDPLENTANCTAGCRYGFRLALK